MRENVRHHYGLGHHFESDAARQRFIDEFETARLNARRLGRLYTVAPGCSLTTSTGTIKRAGEEVFLDDFARVYRHDKGSTVLTRMPHEQLSRLVFEGRIICSSENGVEPEPPRAA